MLNNEDNNSHDATLLHNVIKLCLLLFFWLSQPAAEMTYSAFNSISYNVISINRISVSKRVRSTTVQNRARGETEATAGTSHDAPDQMVVRDWKISDFEREKGCGNVKLTMYR